MSRTLVLVFALVASGCCTSLASASSDLRLAEGSSSSSPSAGIAEVRRSADADYFPICFSSSLTTREAATACRHLGLGVADASFRSKALFPALSSVSAASYRLLSSCSQGARWLTECTVSSTSTCANQAVLSCPTARRWSYRLSGSSAASGSGALQARRDGTGSWGSVCISSFSSREATAACRSLGFGSSQATYRPTVSSEFTTGSTVAMRDLACEGDEDRLDQCENDASNSSTSCTSSTHGVHLTCDTARWNYRLYQQAVTSSTTRGLLQARLSTSAAFGEWGFVCAYSDSLAAVADAACRSLELGGGSGRLKSASTSSYVVPDAAGIFSMSRLKCLGHERSLEDCAFSADARCTLQGALEVTCGGRTSWSYRLIGGASTNQGRLEVRKGVEAEWGTVCDDVFGSTDSAAACRSLGYSTINAEARTVLTAERGHTSTPIVMDNVACSSTTQTLSQCGHLTSSNCDHSEDVFMTCLHWDTRFVPQRGRTSTAIDASAFLPTAAEYLRPSRGIIGRIDVRTPGTTPWGRLCSPSSNDRRAACRALSTTFEADVVLGWTVPASNSTFGSGQTSSGFVALTNPSCSSTAASLDWCTPGSSSTSCGTNEYVLACAEHPWEYRLTAGIAANLGRLEVRNLERSAVWGTVCSRTIGHAEAVVACRGLGLSTASVNYHAAGTTYRGSSSQTVLVSRIRCAGDELSLQQCERFDEEALIADDCGHEDDLFLHCARAPEFSTAPVTMGDTQWEGRLTGGTNFTGRLEVRPNASSPWGTVCSSGFDTGADAATACRSVGMDTGEATFTSGTVQGLPGQPIYMCSVSCTGSVRYLPQCAYQVPAATLTRATSNDVFLRCREKRAWQYRLTSSTNSSTAVSGRLEVRNQIETTWGVVCDDLFGSIDASVACRSAGFSGTSATFTSTSGSPFSMSRIACTGAEAELGDCRYDVINSCSAAADAVRLTCRYPVPAPPPTPAPPFMEGWQVRLVNPSNEITNVSGRLEVRPNNRAVWGTVCDEAFTVRAAKVACVSMGHEPNVIATHESATVTGTGGQPIYMAAVNCLGSEETIDNCTYSDDTTTCSHANDVAVACEVVAPPTPAPTDAPITIPYLYRLTAGPNSTYGRLEVRPHSRAAWGTVCRLPNAAASIACDSLGFTGGYFAEYSWGGPLAGSNASQPIYFRDSACSGSEPRLDQCPNGTRAASTCTHAQDTTLHCKRSTFDFRLRQGESATSGRLEVRPTSSQQWGTICNRGFDTAAAQVACRSLGLSSGTVEFRAVVASELALSSVPMYSDSVRCDGSEPQLDFCEFPAVSACTREQAIHVTCGVIGAPWQYRLVGGGSSVSGRFELRPNSTVEWGTMCARSFSESDATVVCRGLGFDSAVTTSLMEPAANTAFGAGSLASPLWFSGGSCLGSELRPELCASATVACTHAHDVAVSCFPVQTSGWTYRKTPTSGPSGLLETRPNETAPWGTVCTDGFDTVASSVACRTLGFFSRSTVATFTGQTTNVSSPLRYLEDLACTGNEASLDSCPLQRGATPNTCSGLNVEINCRVPQPSPTPELWNYTIQSYARPGRGLLLVKTNSSDPSQAYGTVCSLGFTDVDAAAACRGMGYTGQGARVIETTTAGSSSMPIYVQHAGCVSNSPSLAHCPIISPATDCDHLQDVAIDCSTGDYQYRVVPEGSSGQVARGFEGRLEARASQTAPWGTVCGEAFSQATVDAVCRTMFGRNRGTGAFGVAHAFNANASAGTPVAMSRLICTGSRFATMYNDQCDFSVTSSEGCRSHVPDVYVKCYGTVERTFLNSGGVDFRLEDLSDAGRGRLMARPQGSNSPWGEVCSIGLTTRTAGLICQRLGFENTAEARFSTVSDRSTRNIAPIYLESTTCPRTATAFSECDTGYGGGICGPSRTAIIDCRAGLFQFQLVGSTSARTGRVMIRPNSTEPWGTICSRGITAAAAGAACRSLGFRTDAVASLLPASAVPNANDSVPIRYSSVQCTGTELSLALCTFTSPAPDSCTHDEDLKVTCGAADSESGCNGPAGCGDWILVGQNQRPPCAPTTRLSSIGETMISRADCQRAASMAAVNVTDPGAVASFVLEPDRSYCDIYTCSFTAATLVTIDTADPVFGFRVAVALGTPFRLYAPLRAEASAAGFCTRQVSCTNSGAASTVTFTRVESCVVGTRGCVAGDITIPTNRGKAWEARLVGAVAGQGRVEVRPNSNSLFGTICMTNFDANAAATACLSIGYTDVSQASFRQVREGEQAVRGPTLLSGLVCTGTEENIERCPFVANVDECTHEQDVYLVCSGTDIAATTAAPTTVDPLATTASTVAVVVDVPATNASTNATVDGALTTTVAPTDTTEVVLGSKVVVESVCQCECDVGFFGDDCSQAAGMSTVAPRITVTYTGVPAAVNFAEREAISESATTAAQVAGVRVLVDEGATIGALHKLEFVMSSSTGDSDAASAATVNLLRATSRADVTTALEALATGLRVVDYAAPSFVLRTQITQSSLIDLNTPTPLPPLPDTDGNASVLVTDVALRLPGSSSSGSSARATVTTGGVSYACSLAVVTNPDPCLAETSCTFALPAIPAGEELIVQFTGVVSTCEIATTTAPPTTVVPTTLPPSSNFSLARPITEGTAPSSGSRRQAGSTVNASITYTTQQRLQTSYVDAGGSFLRELSQNAEHTGFAFAIITIVIFVFVVVGNSCYLFFGKDECCVNVLVHLVAFGTVIFYLVFSIFGLHEARTYTPAGYAFIDEYRSPLCDASNITFVPHRISRVLADYECHPLSSFGSSEQSFWARARCSNEDDVYDPANIKLAFGVTEADCKAAEFISVAEGECLDESLFTPGKVDSQLQHVKAFCAYTADAEERTRFIENELDPVAVAAEVIRAGEVSPTDSWIQPSFPTRLFYFVGGWRTYATRFVYDDDEAQSSFAVAAFSETDVAEGRVGLPLDQVSYGGSPPERLDAPGSGPASTMALLAPVFNGFGSSSAVDPSRYGAGAMRLRNIRGTLFDVGTLGTSPGFTLTFWMRASSSTRGFVFLTTDAWSTEDGGTPIASRLQLTIENVERSFFATTWTTYCAVYADGASRSLRLLFRNPDDVSGGSQTDMLWDSTVLQNAFDDRWHFVALGLTTSRNQPFVQLFIDGVTSYTQNSYKKCMAEGGSFPSVRRLPDNVQVTDRLEEAVEQGGVAYIGHLNAGVYAFQVHRTKLEHQVVVKLGATPMLSQAAIWTSESRATAVIFLTVACLMLIVSIVQVVYEYLDNRSKAKEAKDHPDGPLGVLMNKKSAAGQGGAEGAAAVASGADGSNALAQSSSGLIVILPIFMTVCQNMTLYFQGWDWPIEFRVPFGWIYFPFSLDFFVLPTVPIWATYIAQFFVAFLALIVVFWLSRDDNVQFQEQVLQDIAEHGLWRTAKDGEGGSGGSDLPNPKVPSGGRAVSILDYKVGGNEVVGVVSRAALQNKLTHLLLDKNLNSRDPPTHLGDEQVVTVLISTANSDSSRRKIFPCGGYWCCCASDDEHYIPEYIRILAKSKEELPQMLKIAGFYDIDKSGLLDLYRRLDGEQFETYVTDIDVAATDAVKLDELIKTVASHYVLSLHLEEACKRVMEKFKNRVRAAESLTTKQSAGKGKSVAATRASVDRTFDAIRQRVSQKPVESHVLLAALEDQGRTPKHNTSNEDHRIDFAGRSLLLAASEARIDVVDDLRRRTLEKEARQQRNHATAGSMHRRDLAVLGAICSRSSSNKTMRPAIAELIYWMTGNEGSDSDDDLGSKLAIEINFYRCVKQYSAEIMPALVSELTVLQQQVSHTMDVTERSTLFAGYLRLDEHGKPVFKRLLEEEYTEYVDPPAGLASVGPNAAPKSSSKEAEGADKEPGTGTKGGPVADGTATSQSKQESVPAPANANEKAPSSESTPTKGDASSSKDGAARAKEPLATPKKSDKPKPDPEPEKPKQIAELRVRIVAGKDYAVAPSKQLILCPEHATRLFSAVTGLHTERRSLNPKTYQCTHERNKVFQKLCREAGDETFCVTDDFYVCPVDECNFSICGKCINLGGLNKVKSLFAKQRYKLRRDGVTATIGLIVIFIAQAMYQPAMRSAITTVFCHASLSCQYPTCYNPVSLAFFFMSFSSALMIFVIGIGFVWFLVSTVWERKVTILESKALENHMTDNPANCICGEPDKYYVGTASTADVLFVSCDEFPGYDPYQQLLARDKSMFKGIYEQYEFRWMVLNPVTFLFKIGIVMAVLYGGEPNSLSMIVIAGMVEIAMLVFYMMTSPFTDPWLDVLSKGGSLHQVAQLGLMCIYRADTYEDPDNKNSAYFMISLAVLYLILVVVVIIVVVVVPVFAAWKAKNEREAAAKKRNADANQASGQDAIGTSFQVDDDATPGKKETSAASPESEALNMSVSGMTGPPGDSMSPKNRGLGAPRSDPSENRLRKELREIHKYLVRL